MMLRHSEKLFVPKKTLFEQKKKGVCSADGAAVFKAEMRQNFVTLEDTIALLSKRGGALQNIVQS